MKQKQKKIDTYNMQKRKKKMNTIITIKKSRRKQNEKNNKTVRTVTDQSINGIVKKERTKRKHMNFKKIKKKKEL